MRRIVIGFAAAGMTVFGMLAATAAPSAADPGPRSNGLGVLESNSNPCVTASNTGILTAILKNC
ncbi:hypothetical protein ACFYY8_22565 [Streptosporangium sp. NPDC001559]|uniref:hypothetical protein n=1 Tax=Streptosporangium sp. NPDC001559 TaxID=3366187 RepID=UPI0036E56351